MSFTIQTNGKDCEVAEGATVAALIQNLKLVPETILVERNGEVVLRSEWTKVTLKKDDRIELVRVVAGG
jgi:sulfur carrier protein